MFSLNTILVFETFGRFLHICICRGKGFSKMYNSSYLYHNKEMAFLSVLKAIVKKEMGIRNYYLSIYSVIQRRKTEIIQLFLQVEYTKEFVFITKILSKVPSRTLKGNGRFVKLFFRFLLQN